METLLKQMRSVSVRFSNTGKLNKENKEEHDNSSRDSRLQLQKTQSFKEKKKSQSWLRRQFSRQMNQEDYDSSGNGFDQATAVAAAAFAIQSLEELDNIPDKKKTEVSETSLKKTKTKKVEITIAPPEPGGASKRFSGEAQEGKAIEVTITAASPQRKTLTDQKAVGTPSPSTKKTSTFPDKRLDNVDSRKPEASGNIKPESGSIEPKRQYSLRSRTEESDADVWEKAEIARIKKRYDKLNAKILSWETDKKTKAKHRLDNSEREMARKREKTMKRFQREVEYVNQIAGEAKAKADERQRNEILKAKEKANTIRTTGKLPFTCFCC